MEFPQQPPARPPRETATTTINDGTNIITDGSATTSGAPTPSRPSWTPLRRGISSRTATLPAHRRNDRGRGCEAIAGRRWADGTFPDPLDLMQDQGDYNPTIPDPYTFL